MPGSPEKFGTSPNTAALLAVARRGGLRPPEATPAQGFARLGVTENNKTFAPLGQAGTAEKAARP